jgi:DNA polymerase III delta prime subunit
LEEALYGRPAGLDVGVNFSKQAAERVRKYRVRHLSLLRVSCIWSDVFVSQRILLLTGPAGVGKSTSVRAIAGEMGVEVVEWNEGFEDWGFRGDVGKHMGEDPVCEGYSSFIRILLCREGKSDQQTDYVSLEKFLLVSSHRRD